MTMKKPSIYASDKEWQKYLQLFSAKKISLEFAKHVVSKLVSKKNPQLIQKKSRPTKTIENTVLSEKARVAARNSNGRIQNWNSGAKPSSFVKSLGDYRANNEGRYSRSCKYTKYSYDPVYTSYVTVAFSNNGLIYKRGFAGQMKSSLVKSPKGMAFEIDEDGLLLRRKSDKMDFHINGDTLEKKNFVTYVRKQMAANYKIRLRQKKEAKLAEIQAAKDKSRAEFLDKIFKADLKTTMVTLHDSRKAGNCIEGSLSFAERKLGIGRQEIIGGGHLFKVRGEKLFATGENRAIAAVKQAWARETTVCI